MFNFNYNQNQENPLALEQLHIQRENTSEITFLEDVKPYRINSTGCYSFIQLDPLIELEDKRVRVYTEDAQEFNKPARIIFQNVEFAQPKITKDGQDCLEPFCRIIFYNQTDQTLIVEVQNFSEYIVVEGETPPPSSPSGSSGSSSSGSLRTRTTTTTIIPDDTTLPTLQPTIPSTTTSPSLIVEDQPSDTQQPEKRNLIFYIVGITLILTLIIIGIIYYFSIYKKEDPSISTRLRL